jgi:formate dehydrogenase subunit gamma
MRERTDIYQDLDLGDFVRAVVDAHIDDRGPLLPILHDLQEAMGYIHPDAIPVLAKELNISRADVFGVVTFYRDFRDREGGRCRVRICAAEACQSVGSDALARHARTSLGVEFGETTSDGAVLLDEVFCLGNCALGPAVQIDGVVYGRMDADSLDSILSEKRA